MSSSEHGATATDDDFDLVILGAGSGGYACALRAAQLGQRVALIERDRLGGTCLHVGCIPTKALLHAAEVADAARESETFGVKASFEGIDLERVHAYKDGVVGRLYKGLQGLVASRDITYVEGTGRLTSPTTVTVSTSEGERALTGRSVVLATGSAARTLPGIEIGGRVMTSLELLSLRRLPSSVVVLGGGVIGVELASVLASFGAQVTIVEALPRLVPAEDGAVSKALERAFRKRGITTRTGARVSGVTQDDDGVRVELEGGEALSADLLLVAVGRGPVTEGLGLDEVGVATDRGWVTVDEHLQTSVPGVYAVGDIVPGLQLAHRGFAHGIYLAEQLAGLDPAPLGPESGIPRVTYCDPEIVSVGLTSEQAADAHGADHVESLEYNLGGNGKSQILGTQGFVKLVRRTDGPVLGVHMIGARMSEQVGEAQLLIGWDAFPDDVTPLVHAHPTQNEAVGEAMLALAGKPLHAHT